MTLAAAKGWNHINYGMVRGEPALDVIERDPSLYKRCLFRVITLALHLFNYFGRARLQQKHVLIELLNRIDLDINAKDTRTGMTALHYASLRGDDPEFIQMLLDKGADPKILDNCGNTPFDLTKFSYSLTQQIIFLATDVEISWVTPYSLQDAPPQQPDHPSAQLYAYIRQSYQPPIHGWGVLRCNTATLPSQEERNKNITQIRQILQRHS